MFKQISYLFIVLLSLSTQAMQTIKEEREPRKDNPILHIRSPEQKNRKLEKLQLNSLRNSQKAVEHHALINAVKGTCSTDMVLQRILDSE